MRLPVPLSSSAERTSCTQVGTFALRGSRLSALGRAPPFSVEMFAGSLMFFVSISTAWIGAICCFFLKKQELRDLRSLHSGVPEETN